MNTARKRVWYCALLCLLFFFFLLLLCNAGIAAEGVKTGLTLCTGTLIPSLFPFLVLCDLMLSLGVTDLLKSLFSRPVSALFGLSPACSGAFVLGALCGFPIGTTSALTLRRQGEISPAEMRRTMLICNNPSVGFLVGVVGSGMFHSVQAGVALFVITQSSALLVGVLLRLLFGKPAGDEAINRKKDPPALSVSLLTASIKAAFAAMLQVCAFLLFFSCICACVNAVIARFSLPGWVAVLGSGMLELTAGINAAVVSLDAANAFRAAAAFSAFSGLCVCLQLYAVAEGSAPPLYVYLLCKSAQAALSLLLSDLYLRLCSPILTPPVALQAINNTARRPTVLILLAALLIATLSIQKRKRRPLRAQSKKGS